MSNIIIDGKRLYINIHCDIKVMMNQSMVVYVVFYELKDMICENI